MNRSALLGAAFLVCAAGLAGVECGEDRRRGDAEKALVEQIRLRATDREHLARAEAKVVDLSGALAASDAEASQLRVDLVAAMERPERVVTVTEIRTVVEAGEVLTVARGPGEASHSYALANGLVVARYDRDAEGVETHRTYALHMRGTVAIGDGEGTSVFEMSSNADPSRWSEVPVDLGLVEVRTSGPKERVAGLRVGLGLTGSISSSFDGATRRLDATASVVLPWLHPHRNVSVLGARFGVNGAGARGGLDLVAYNIGSPLPVVDDLWIAVGVSAGTDATWSGDLTVYTRL